jgi:hypothetical protein
MSEFDFDLIGIDGGATEVKAHLVLLEGSRDKPVFKLGDVQAFRKYERIPDFAPVPVQDQFKQRDEGKIELTPSEIEQGDLYIEATAQVVKEIVSMAGSGKPVLIGMGMPGLKPPDGRGINVINHGPRMPKYLEKLEEKLKKAGVQLAGPIDRLGSDADYCGIGENHAEGGAFKNVENAYYAGLGTGVADAMKLKGELVTFDSAKAWIQKSWQMTCSLGVTFEKVVSAKSMNTLYANLMGREGDVFVQQGRFPQDDALQGSAPAQFTMQTVAGILAELLFERLHTVAGGRKALSFRGQAYVALSPDHPYRGVVLDRLVIGQRLGFVFSDSKYSEVFREPLLACLAGFIRERGGDALKSKCLARDGEIVEGLVVGSRLRAAPAIGAAVAAFNAAVGANA